MIADAKSDDPPGRNETGSCVVAPVRDPDARSKAIALGHAIATARDTELCIAGATGGSTELAETHRTDCRVEPTAVPIGDRRFEQVASRHEPAAIIIGRERGGTLVSELLADPAVSLANATGADVLTVGSRGAFDSVASVLAPIAAGPHTPVAVEAACAIARAYDAAVDLFHVADERSDRGEKLLSALHDRCLTGDLAGRCSIEEPSIDTWLYDGEDASTAIAEQSAYYDVVVMGAPRSSRLERIVFGSTARDVQRRADAPVVVAHSG